MATVERLAIRREAALNRLSAAVQSLTEQHDLDLGEFPVTGKDALMLQAEQIEWTANALEALADAPGSPQRDESGDNAFDITKLNRDDLNTYAEAHGIDNPASYPNKPALIAAIEDALTAPDGPNGDEDA
jgi:hypothetical protein